MNITVTIDLEDAFLKSIVERAVRDGLAPPYGGERKGADGYERIRVAAARAIAELDVAPIIRDVAARMVDGIVRDVVGDMLRRKVREELKVEMENGELFAAQRGKGDRK